MPAHVDLVSSNFYFNGVGAFSVGYKVVDGTPGVSSHHIPNHVRVYAGLCSA